MAVTTTNNVSQHIFIISSLLVKQGGILNPDPEKLWNLKRFSNWFMMCNSTLQGRVFSILFPLLESSPESLTFPLCRKYSVRTICHNGETEHFQNNKIQVCVHLRCQRGIYFEVIIFSYEEKEDSKVNLLFLACHIQTKLWQCLWVGWG